ncbi:MAG TPA: hypothetical protein VKZ60_01310 [Chloroflexota bacterium]|nr:hypothetical protein [Chloroflexota bacterium]
MPTSRPVDAAALYRAWYAAAGPWAGYWRAVPLIGLARGAARPVPRAAAPARATAPALAAEIVARGGTDGWLGRSQVLVVLDLPAAEGVLVACALAAWNVRPVLVFPQWPAPRATVACAALLAVLAAPPPPLPAVASAQYAFVLARERAAALPAAVLATRLDTRYALGTADLPDAAALGAAGVTALSIVRRAALPWPDDLAAYTQQLRRHGLPVRDVPLRGPGALC